MISAKKVVYFDTSKCLPISPKISPKETSTKAMLCKGISQFCYITKQSCTIDESAKKLQGSQEHL